MKKFIKIAAILMSCVLFGCTFVGCGERDSSLDKNAPDYSESDKQYTIWSYGATCNDWYMVNGKKYYFEQGSLQTEEHTKLYKDGGFNLLFIDYTFSLHTLVQKFEGSDLERVMDLAEEQGLKCFLYQPELHSLSNFEGSRIDAEKAALPENEGEYFASQEDLNEYVAKILEPLFSHNAFCGVSLVDEPKYTKFQCIKEVYLAIKAAFSAKDRGEPYVMMNILPYANSDMHKNLYCGTTDISAEDAYKLYLETYYETVGKECGYIQYDDYPIINGGILDSFLYCNQVISRFAKEKGLERRTAFQTTKYSNRRSVKAADMYFQLNVGMATGNREFTYYTYYPTVNTADTTPPDETAFIVNRQGEPNDLYYTLKEFHKEMQFNAKALLNFEYCGMQFLAKKPLPTGMGSISGLENDTFEGGLKGFDAEIKIQSGGLVIVTESYDKANDRYGYYVVNCTDPACTSEAVVTLDFGSYKHAQIYQFAKTENVSTNDGKVTVNLGTGGGAFVMPY